MEAGIDPTSRVTGSDQRAPGPRRTIRRSAVIVIIAVAGTIVPFSAGGAWTGTTAYPYISAKDCSGQFGTYSWCIDSDGNGRYSAAEQWSPYGFGYRNCTDFVAWMVNTHNKVGFSNGYGGRTWGNANTWDDAARALGIRVDRTPAVGAVAQSDSGGFGHVAYVTGVHADNTVTVAEYNWAGTGGYGQRRVPKTTFPNYIHLADLSQPTFTASSPPATATVGSTFSYGYKASGKPAPTFARSGGTLPPGLTLSSNGTLSGKPTTTGVFSFTVKATNAVGTATSATRTITVVRAPQLTSANPPSGKVGAPYTYQFTASGYPTPTFAVAAGSVPPGLGLSSNGALSGTPTSSGRYTFSVRATNIAGTATTATLTVEVVGSGPYTGPEDLDGDGCVGLPDLNLVLVNWGAPGGPADINGDGTVSIIDYNAVISKWGQGTCSAT